MDLGVIFPHLDLQSSVELRFRLGIRAAVGQQPAQFLVAYRLAEPLLQLPAQRNASAQVVLGGVQRADGELIDGQVCQASGKARFVSRLFVQVRGSLF